MPTKMHGHPEDINMVFAEAVALTLAAGTNDLGVEIDLRSQLLPHNTPVWLVMKMEAAGTSGGSATVQFKHLTDADSAYGSAVEVHDSGAIAVATLVADYLIVSIPVSPEVLERYNKITVTVATADLLTGTTTAFLTTVKPFRNIP